MELWVWTVVAVLGLMALPFVGVRRHREQRYYTLAGGNGARGMLLQNRAVRAALLSVAVVLCVAAAAAFGVFQGVGHWRTIGVAALILVEICLVAALWLDEIFAMRVDRLIRRKHIRDDHNIG